MKTSLVTNEGVDKLIFSVLLFKQFILMIQENSQIIFLINLMCVFTMLG